MRAAPPLLVLSLCALGRADTLIDLTNHGADLFQHVVEVGPVESPGPEAVPALRTSDGAPAIAQVLADGRLLLLVEGLWASGETRRFRLGWSTEKRRDLADLTVKESDGGGARLDNSYLGMTFAGGPGGFPTGITFSVSGTVEEGFLFYDRLYDKQRGFFSPQNDPEARAQIVEPGPLRVVVEQRFRYMQGGQNPGGARATYRWTFTAHSPVVGVDGTITRDADLDFVWPELHFLQISRDDARFPRWAGGDPLTQGALGPQSYGRGLGRWGVLYNGLDALGMAIEGGLTFWDGTTEYVTYLQRVDSWEGARRDYHADLYLGPARAPERIRDALLARPNITLSVRDAATPEEAPIETAATLQNERLRLGFARNANGSLGLTTIARPGGERGFIADQPAGGARLWRLTLHGPGVEPVTLSSEEFGPCEAATEGSGASFTWRNVSLPDEPGALDVTVAVELPEGSPTSLWRLRVDNRSTRYGVFEAQFPVIAGLGKRGECDVAIPRSNWGVLYRNLQHAEGGSYPSAVWPMQMLTVNQAHEGLYLACHDPEAWPKTFHLQPGNEFRFAVWAANAGVPGSGFETPGAVAVGVYEGDWWRGCKLYRDWAAKSAPWTQKGRLSQREDTPESLKNLALWFLGGGTRDEIVPAMLRANDFFNLPIGLHWYSWHEIEFDTHYPEYFPTKPGFAEGVKELTSRGMLAMPYINGRLHDMDIPSFAEAEPWCTKQENGERYMEVYPSQARQAVMCPYTEYWQQRINGVIERLAGECGVNAVYLDQIAAAGPALCFDPDHGHPLGGGSHWVDGYRKLLRRTKEIGHRDGRDVAFTTENNAEPYMDGVDAFLVWNPRQPNEIPMMTAVYSGYSLYFSSPRTQNDPQSFWMGQARDCIWGCQLGWMDPSFFTSPAHLIEGAALERLGEYRVVGRKFLTYGELLGELSSVEPLPEIHGTWDNWSGPPQQITLPAVKTAVWRAEDGSLGLFIANLSEGSRRFRFRLDPAAFGGFAAEGKWLELKRVSPEGAQVAGYMPAEGGERTEYLTARDLLVYEVKPVAKLPEARRVERQSEQRPALDAWCLERGVTWDVHAPRAIAEGEPMWASVQVTNGGRSPLTVAVARGVDSARPGPWLQQAVPPGEMRSVHVETGWGDVGPPSAWLWLTVRLSDAKSAVETRVPIEVPVLPPATVAVRTPIGLRAGETAALALDVTSNLADARDVTVGLRLPTGWDVEPGPNLRVPRLTTGNTRTVWVKVSVPQTQAATTEGIEAYVIASRTSAQAEVLPPRPRAEAPGAQAAPTIDGDLAEWSAAPALGLGKGAAANLREYGGEADVSGQVRVMWDDACLYFAAEVADQQHTPPQPHQDMWQGDCIQIALRPRGPARSSAYDGVHELGLALTVAGPELWQWMPEARVVTDGKVAVVRQEDRTLYEAAIPWSALGMTSQPGARPGFSLTLNDNDGAGFRGWLEWSGGLCGPKDASKFGVLWLK
ncbi:MAG: hypothetical protein FJX74_00560 [Armatimonadetes bacterium]|nr:hypothetical protein [Armatimonadota bacterium]